MFNLENFLVQYATFNWQHIFVDLNIQRNAICILCFIFVLLFITKWIFNSKKPKKFSSKFTQTDGNSFPQIQQSNETVCESGEILLESIFNHKFSRNYILNCWITNFNEFKFSQIISKNCRIVEFDEEYCEPFKISQIKIIENKELVTFTFRLKCTRLFLTIELIYEEQQHRQAHLNMTDIELSALVMIRFSDSGLLLKLFPDCVCDMHCELLVDGITNSEREMSLTEFKRDFKLIMMQTLEMEWKSQTALPILDNEISEIDRLCQLGESHINDVCSQDVLTNHSFSTDDIELIEENRVMTEASECCNQKIENAQMKEMMSHISLFTNDSYNFYDHGEESPFHDRVSSRLVGRTLVVGLVKVVEAQELKNPLKHGYCVLELDEPYQRHVSHLISLTDYPIWNQHFIFSLNSNSQRLTIELFHASKKCQNPFSLGVSVIPISLIIVDPSENYFPINNNQIGSRKSWRCDVIPGDADSKIPAFLIEFQIMKNVHDLTKSTVDPPSDISSNNSGISLSIEKTVKIGDNSEPDSDNGHKMQTIPEAQTPDNNTLTKNRSTDENKVFLRDKPGSNENGRSKSVIRRIRHRFSRLSVPWMSEKSKSDDCLDHISDDNETQTAQNSEIPVQPPAELFLVNSTTKPKFFSKISDVDLRNSRSLSISLKKVFNIPTKKQTEKYKEKSLEQLFKEMDPKIFDTISNEGFNRIMNTK